MNDFTVVVTLPGTSEHFTQTCSGSVTVGRSEECDIRLSHPLVSRHHAEISRGPEGDFLIRDLASRNGTSVNGVLLHDAQTVAAGSLNLQVGPYLLLLAPPISEDGSTLLLDIRQKTTRLSLDRGKRTLLLDGELILKRLSVLEYRLLDALVSAAPNLAENKALGDAIWGTDQWDVYMLHNLVRRIRRKLEEEGADSAELIATVPGVGYRLV